MKRFLLTSILLFGLAGCANKSATTPAIPAVPANVQMANLSKTLADTLNTAAGTTITLRDNKLLTEAETVTVQNYIVLAAQTDKKVNAELLSADDWPTQRIKIIQMWTSVGLRAVKSSLSTNAGLVIDTILSVVNQIMVAIGGPVI